MSLNTQPYKGTRDFYPEDMRLRNFVFNKIRQVCESYGYEEYDAPVLEPAELYLSKTSEEIVNDQSYSFTDRGDRKVIMRPEMTPSVSRMVAARRQELGYPLRLYSISNFFRYERPQKGRLREFWQLNTDIFGVKGFEADVEIIKLADSIIKAFGAKTDMYEIRINSKRMLDIKINASGPKKDISEIIAFLDKKNKMPENEFFEKLGGYFTHVAAIKEWLSSTSEDDMGSEIFDFKEKLEKAGIKNVVIDPAVIRGFGYYTDIVFEVFDKNPGNNRSLFGGGRYDGLVANFGVEPVPTVGFGMGDVTLFNFLESWGLMPDIKPATDVAVLLIGDVYDQAQPVIEKLRGSGVNVAVDYEGRKVDKKIKSAVKNGVKYALFIGSDEIQKQEFSLKDLQSGKEFTGHLEALATTILKSEGLNLEQ